MGAVQQQKRRVKLYGNEEHVVCTEPIELDTQVEEVVEEVE